MEAAPFLADLAHAPKDARIFWTRAGDGVRLRLGAFNGSAPKGTVLLFPGRTEYIEKYGPAATQLAARGYATLSIDWRGQGLADRAISDPLAGHVADFSEYQLDVAAMLKAAEALSLPRPWHMLAHSMGGCIGLRALHLGLPVGSVVFTGPMWGIKMAAHLRPVAWALSWGSRHVGMGHRYAPGTVPEPYVLSEPFETNKLTSDAQMYQMMIDQTLACPELGLGGPSLHWLYEALKETRDLARMPSPDLPCITFTGTQEDIVDLPRIRDRMNKWPRARMEWIEGARHEVLMEDEATRTRIYDQMTDFFGAHTGKTSLSGRGLPAAAAAQAL